MDGILKIGGAAAVGTAIPLISEFALQGRKDLLNMKDSGLIGVGVGAVSLLGAYMNWYDQDVLAALGGSSLTMGAGILILDYLRTKGSYTFRQNRLRQTGGRMPLAGHSGLELERTPEPVVPLVEEI